MSDFLLQFFPPQPTDQQSIINIDTPLIENDDAIRRQKAEDIALITAYGENLSLYRKLKIDSEGGRR